VLVQWPMLPPRDELGLLEGRLGKFVSSWNFRDGMGTRIGTFTETCCVGHGSGGQADCEGGDKSSIERGEERGGVNMPSRSGSFCARWRPELPFWL
jgi:hypothetical protein